VLPVLPLLASLSFHIHADSLSRVVANRHRKRYGVIGSSHKIITGFNIDRELAVLIRGGEVVGDDRTAVHEGDSAVFERLALYESAAGDRDKRIETDHEFTNLGLRQVNRNSLLAGAVAGGGNGEIVAPGGEMIEPVKAGF